MIQTLAQILPCIEYQKNLKKILAPEKENIIFDLTPPPMSLKNTYTSQENELWSLFYDMPEMYYDMHVFYLGTILTLRERTKR